MKHVSILALRGNVSLVNLEGTLQILNEVNGFLRERGGTPLFDVHIVGLPPEADGPAGPFIVVPDALITDVKKTELIFIPAVHDDQRGVIERNRAFIPWLREQYANGAQIASFCIGAFVLAATGLLDGRQCATHPLNAREFRRMFPKVELVDHKVVTESDRLFTSGGAFSFLNLLLYLIERHAGREIAVLTAKVFMVDIERDSQSSFAIFRGQRDHGDRAVTAAQDYIEANFKERITIARLADVAAVGRRSLERRFRTATENTVAQYLQRVKIEAAKRRLEGGTSTVFEAMYEVGYSDIKAFRSVFKRHTGMTPVEYRRKYLRAAGALRAG